MLTKIRQAMKGEEGFTLIELMVVILIIGILMAIAIPSFFAVRNRAYRASAESVRSTAVKTIELYATDNDGEYTGMDVADLTALEKSIVFNDGAAPANTDEAYVDAAHLDADSYAVRVLGRDGTTYYAHKQDGGAVDYGTGAIP